MRISNLKFKTKLGLIIGTPLLAILIISNIYEYNIRQSTLSRNLLEHYNNIDHMASGIGVCMLQARRAEKDFLIRKELEYQKKVSDQTQCVETTARELATLAAKLNEKDLSELAEKIIQLIRSYHGDFQQVVQEWEKRGLNHESGLQGQFRSSAHDLETRLNNYFYFVTFLRPAKFMQVIVFTYKSINH
ncbi:MAG: hypothetical protein HQL77_19240, partial [Magnetococcales bacterium]|nr:hypothetical protein [Magnetococcales bacterium]